MIKKLFFGFMFIIPCLILSGFVVKKTQPQNKPNFCAVNMCFGNQGTTTVGWSSFGNDDITYFQTNIAPNDGWCVDVEYTSAIEIRVRISSSHPAGRIKVMASDGSTNICTNVPANSNTTYIYFVSPASCAINYKVEYSELAC